MTGACVWGCGEERRNKAEKVVRDEIIKEFAGDAKKIWALLRTDDKPLKVFRRKMAFQKGGFINMQGMV